MPIYRYKAKKGPGKIIEAEITANSKAEAVERISQMGYLPMKIEEMASSMRAASASGVFRQKIKSKHITIFTRQLAILLRSGVPILKGLTILSDQAISNHFKLILQTIRSEIKDGKTLSSSLALYPKIFSTLYLALVRAGEDSGTLEEALIRIAEYRDKQEKIFSNIRTALTYPILMGIVGISTILFMLIFVMPRLLKIFTRLGQDLPLPTKILIAISNFLNQGWVWAAVAVIAGLCFLFASGKHSKRRNMFISKIKLRLPLFGELFLKAELARFSRTLELLLKSGIQLLKALKRSIPVLENEIVRQELKKGYTSIEQGESFAAVLDKSSAFPKFMVNLVSVGEESGKLEEALQELAQTYEAETDEAVKTMTNLLEPIMILVMGLIVGFIIVCMLLPVFQLNIMVR